MVAVTSGSTGCPCGPKLCEGRKDESRHLLTPRVPAKQTGQDALQVWGSRHLLMGFEDGVGVLK